MCGLRIKLKTFNLIMVNFNLHVPSYKNNNSDKYNPEPGLKILFDLAGSKIYMYLSFSSL